MIELLAFDVGHPPILFSRLGGLTCVRRDMGSARPHLPSMLSAPASFPFALGSGGPFGPGSPLQSPFPSVAPISAAIPAAHASRPRGVPPPCGNGGALAIRFPQIPSSSPLPATRQTTLRPSDR